MGIKEITRCINYICLNLKKGGSDVVTSLNDVVNECFENKKTVAKRKGEKASTSMTFPMILTLIAIILAIGAPAYLSLGGSIV
jgi:tight adherence protein C